MSNLIIGFILVLGIYSGARRGLVVQLVHTAGHVMSYVVALLFHGHVAKLLANVIPYPSDTSEKQLALFNLLQNVAFDKTFYNAIAFIVLLIIGWLVTRLVGASLHRVTKIPVLHQLNWIGGALLGLLTHWIGLFFILSLLAVLPVAPIQSLFQSDSLATFIVKQTPLFSQMVFELWVTYRK